MTVGMAQEVIDKLDTIILLLEKLINEKNN